MFKKGKNKLLKKIVAGILSITMGLTLFLAPPILAVAVPALIVNEIFKSIGGIFSADNEIITYLDEYFLYDDTTAKLLDLKNYIAKNGTGEDIQLSWIVIPNLLAGIENPTEEQISFQINIIQERDKDACFENDNCGGRSLIDYISELKKQEPYSDEFKNVKNNDLIDYINHYRNLLTDLSNIDEEYLEGIEEGDYIYPFTKKALITSTIGYRSFFLDGKLIEDYHDAIDFAFPRPENCGIPIYAVTGGTVKDNNHGKPKSWGNYGYIQSNDGKIMMEYWHMETTFPYAIGTKIETGDFIGTIGSTGYSTGCHLHLAFKYDGQVIDPRNYIPSEPKREENE